MPKNRLDHFHGSCIPPKAVIPTLSHVPSAVEGLPKGFVFPAEVVATVSAFLTVGMYPPGKAHSEKGNSPWLPVPKARATHFEVSFGTSCQAGQPSKHRQSPARLPLRRILELHVAGLGACARHHSANGPPKFYASQEGQKPPRRRLPANHQDRRQPPAHLGPPHRPPQRNLSLPARLTWRLTGLKFQLNPSESLDTVKHILR